MAVIPNSNEKIQEESLRTGSAVAEDALTRVGAAVNYLLDQVPLLDDKTLKTQVFLSSGTFTVPADVTTVIVEGCGGGGAGSTYNFFGDQASVGGNGAAKGIAILSVTPNDAITVTIGAGGVCGSPPSVGGNGGNSSFGTLAVFRGAAGGGATRQYNKPIEQGESLGGGNYWNTVRQDAQGSAYGFTGGLTKVVTVIPAGFGYGGGAGPYGNGGDGGQEFGGSLPAVAGAPNSGAGGGGANTSTPVGASGGSGRIIVTYVSKF